MSILCTRRRDAGQATPSRVAIAALIFALVLAACGGSGGATPTAGPTPTLPIALPSPSPTLGVTPTATYSPALDALLAPGPTLPAPPRFFFRNGGDLWVLPAAEPARAVLSGERLGAVAQLPDGSRAAVVIYREADGQATEELRLIDAGGTLSEPVYGPVTTSDGGAARIAALDWAWDGALLAIAFTDGSLGAIPALNDPFVTPQPPLPVATPAGVAVAAGVRANPGGTGIAYLVSGESGSTLFVTPSGDAPRPVLAGDDAPAVRAFDWLPGRGRLVFAEDRVASTGATGSVFTIAPDGTALELLLSAGQFSPAASFSLLEPSPDGRLLALTVLAPDGSGRPRYDSLWVQSIDSRALVQVQVERGYRVSDLWWSEAGLCWRGIDLGAPAADDTAPYGGSEPFVIGCANPETGDGSVVFRPDAP